MKNLLKKLDELDDKVAEWQGIKFDRTVVDFIMYVIPRAFILVALFLLTVIILVNP